MDIEFLIKYLMKKTSAAETQQVKEWLNSNEKNQTYFVRLKEWYDKEPPLVSLSDAEVAQDWQKVKAKALDKKEAKDKAQGKTRRLWVTRIAAAVVVLGVAFGLIYFGSLRPQPTPVAYTQSKSAQSLNKKAWVLEDGTKVWLNKNARIYFPEKFDDNRRMVRLEGEGFFEVKRDEKRPFTVQTNGVDVRVLGTSFNIYQKDSTHTKVTVNSGKVAVATKDGAQRVELVKGEASNFNAQNASLSKALNRDLNYLAWKTGALVFKKATMEQIVADLQRHYQVNISCAPALRQQFGFNGTFKDQPLKEVLQVLEATLEVKVVYDRNAIFIK
ncbi:FecR family protein [Microscilla marina]|uniref:Putative anti-sigma factor n=1 Tax=Microscilla marina ATCC 23134 TaxID=313606 RepID=A1ZZH4_MICM2|nr:FecR domain-containing protein [Microscilla marina]EAY24220.1 putative anti-sigma factor [Microscilla marina ATCC 23134]